MIASITFTELSNEPGECHMTVGCYSQGISKTITPSRSAAVDEQEEMSRKSPHIRLYRRPWQTSQGQPRAGLATIPDEGRSAEFYGDGAGFSPWINCLLQLFAPMSSRSAEAVLHKQQPLVGACVGAVLMCRILFSECVIG